MQLTDQEKESDLWMKLKAHLTGLIDKSHIELEKSISPELTQEHRGRIKAIRGVLKLALPQPARQGPEN